MHIRHLAVVLGALSLSLSQTQGAVVNYTFAGASFTNFGGTPVPDGPNNTGTLFQLVNLGPDGIFNGIDLNDGDVTLLGQWVSGDDTLLNVVLAGNSDTISSNAFDLFQGAGTGTAGYVERSLTMDVAEGTKFGIRWFPNITANQFGTVTLAAGQKFGQYTRQNDTRPGPQYTGPYYDGSVYGGALWVGVASGLSVALDPLNTLNSGFGGVDPNDTGRSVFEVVPEPATVSLALLGTLGIFSLRRRRR